MRLAVTRDEPQTERYAAPGGPWDVPDLDTLLHGGVLAGDAQLVDGYRRTGPVELERLVAVVAGSLRAAGVGAGDVVAWQLPTCTESVVLSRACWRLGAIAAPLHHRSGATEIAPLVELIDPTLVLAAAGAPLSAEPDVVVMGADVPWLGLPGGDPIVEGVASGPDLALVLFTSGSTGRPKAVLHTHRGLAAKAMQMVRVHGLSAHDVTLAQSPMAHISGILNGVLVPQLAGMNQILMERWDPALAVKLVHDERVSFMIGPPTVFHSLFDAAGERLESLRSIRLVSCGGTGVTPEFVAETSSRLGGASVKRSYGCTEAPTVTTAAVGDPAERAATTDGRADGYSEVLVVDPVTKARSAPGIPGEVLLRGPELFAGYAIASQTESAMDDGWFSTGDLGVLDDDGWLTIVGRIKDVIIRGGENIAPAEVERILEAHPAIQQAVVVGVPHERLGERVAAFVVADEPIDVATCRAWFAEQGIASFKMPELVDRVDELPLLSLGKPDRAELARRARVLP